MKKTLRKEFFDRPTLEVARDLVGAYLVRESDGKITARKITEVEAYDGFEDAASHAHRGRTQRNATMFGEAGRLYVYLVYGIHTMLNVVTGPPGYPAAVLIRGIEGASGPGRVTKALAISRESDGARLGRSAGIWIENRGVRIDPARVKRLPRVGVLYAGPEWSSKPYRFMLE